MAKFIEAYQRVIMNEGIYSNDPDDKGGRTVMGISEKNFPAWDGWKIVDKLSTSKEIATNQELQLKVQAFYLNNFWNAISGDEIISQEKANSIFDFAVNTGVKTAVRLAQTVCGITSDGVVGKNTISVLNTTHDRIFIAEYKLAKIARYCDIVDNNQSQIKFLKGWIKRALK